MGHRQYECQDWPDYDGGSNHIFCSDRDLERWGITAGPDGALWFTANDTIGRMSTHGIVTMYPASPPSLTYGITTGPDGALWITYHCASRVQPAAARPITTNE